MLHRTLHHHPALVRPATWTRFAARAIATTAQTQPESDDRPVPGIPLTGPADAPLPASHPPNDEIPPRIAKTETAAAIAEDALQSPRSDPHVPKSVTGKVVRKVKDMMHPLNAGAEAAAEAIAQRRRETREAEQANDGK
ncbi:hypothetical protein AMAG_00986 [Allomyces macrogynus ATCC 38327]|uniref:Uncharacterized protein n=1 Tax=Allomyces macrogynus (strain ATCC 38327) TaxID=578462 RepID=A0A0L0RY93_ALLM3|nr:hypothetical protein AMAG_00986 [Allomyces macrogynus ATCC 38327]|eukprot:KNE55049.1 hypothetical protein AMAG_00986 [Allomyces macrogynus ATCC 38327]